MKYRLQLLLILLLSTVFILGIQAAGAQDSTIEITGTVESVGSGIITVNGLPVDLSSVDANTVTQLVANSTVRIVGSLQNGVVIAVTIEIISQPTPQPPAGPATVDIEKLISVDGGATWQDADNAPGPQVDIGTPVLFRFVVRNTGQTALTNLLLTDNTFDVSTCAIPASLAPGALFECSIGPFNAVAGQHRNLATIIAASESGGDSSTVEVRDTDSAHYFGGDRPSIRIEKSVSKDRSTWHSDDDEPEIEVGADVFFRFVVTNNGTVPVSEITLNDSSYSTAGCAIPASLEPAASFECIIGPFNAAAGRHTNTVTVRARYNEFDILDSDSASYFGGKRDDTGQLPVTIVIEGPVQNININVITIYNINIEIDINDPILTVIQIGDIVRVEGSKRTGDDDDDNDNRIIIVAVTVVIINIDVYISDDHTIVWRDNNNCGNPPPPWAPAHGWRRRCEGRGGNIIIIGDDDDDDDRGRGRGRGRSGSS